MPQQKIKLPAHEPRKELSPNKYHGAFLIAHILTLNRYDLKPTEATKNDRTKIYLINGFYYIAPPAGIEPPLDTWWLQIGKKYSRAIYRATALGNRPPETLIHLPVEESIVYEEEV